MTILELENKRPYYLSPRNTDEPRSEKYIACVWNYKAEHNQEPRPQTYIHISGQEVFCHSSYLGTHSYESWLFGSRVDGGCSDIETSIIRVS